MGIFDGVLICSDFDGTIYNGKEIPKVTVNAINRFMTEGGKFCICTGRGPEFLREMSHFVKGNTYSICYGGALICDAFSGEVLHEGLVGDEAFSVLEELLNSEAKTVRINVMRPGDIIDRYTPEEYFLNKATISHNAYKITLNGESDEDGRLYYKFAKEHHYDNYVLARSFASYTEIMRRENTKGYAAKLLKEHLGAGLLVGMGDYENDIPLFREVDVSYAVGNAVDELKAIASKVVSETVNSGAAAAIIRDIEQHL